ncbi:MAG: undecaprenyl-diphosphatase UppP [Lachnospiraceae bacterium]|jgi:undecaprenyl-diphosphatase|nr:undecaprenyl-diphosphatase UppP [Lachnospiraceae bacterium]
METIGYLQALIMGLVQGLTEFLPVSSSGHLVLSKFILGAQLDTSALFEILLHVGTLGAVFIVFWKDVWSLIQEGIFLIRDCVLWVIKRKKLTFYPERKMLLLIIIASIPTAILGLLMEKFLEDLFLSSLIAVGFALLVTGTFLLLIRRMPQGHKKLGQMKNRDAVTIGIIQGIATIPGISRSGSTVAAGLFCGLDKEFAFRFSFLMSIPAILGAAVLKLTDVSGADLAANAGPYLIGMVVAALTGYLCVKWLRNLIQKNQFHYFGYYCLLVGMLSIIWGIFR